MNQKKVKALRKKHRGQLFKADHSVLKRDSQANVLGNTFRLIKKDLRG